MFKFSSLILTTLLLFVSCGEKTNSNNRHSKENPLIGGNKNQTPNDCSLTASNQDIWINKSALGHLFLMTSAQISSGEAPTGYSQAAKLVYFKKYGTELAMMESQSGKVATDDVETETLLATFPIIDKKENCFVFNFKSGMSNLYERSSYYVSDFPTTTNETALKVTSNTLRKVENRGKYLFIDQIARVNKGNKNNSVHLKYTFSSYSKNEGFKKKKSPGLRKTGYFENHPVTEAHTGEKTTYIIKFDERNQITFYLSNNIPKEYKEAMKDGILYWNTVFGKEMVAVENLPEGISVHEPGYNVVQWLEWDTAGFAYANMMSDPLTGENLQSHVYMTSVFGKSGLKKAKRLYERLKAEKKPVKAPTQLQLKGFKSTKLCAHDSNDEAKQIHMLGEAITTVEDLDISDEEKEIAFLRFAQDYVREVVAHEVGHTLGMRHNFTGSLATKVKPSEFKKISKEYLLTGNIPLDFLPGSTVMDYSPNFFAAMLGAHIRTKRAALPYDKATMDYAYTDAKIEDLNFGTFCTDKDRSEKNFADCKTFDRFSNVIEASHYNYQETISNLSMTIAQKFEEAIEKKEEGETKVDALKKVRLQPAKQAIVLATSLVELFEMIHSETKFAKIERAYEENKTPYENEQIGEKYDQFQISSLNNLGGITKVIFDKMLSEEEEGEKVMISLIKDLNAEAIRKSKKLLGDFGLEEIEIVEGKINMFMTYFEKEFLRLFTKLLTVLRPVKKEKGFEDALTTFTKGILFKKNQEVIASTETVEVFGNHYNYGEGKENLRFMAMTLLNTDLFPGKMSYMLSMNSKKTELKNLHEAEMKKVTDTLDESDVEDSLIDWLGEEVVLFSSIKAIQ